MANPMYMEMAATTIGNIGGFLVSKEEAALAASTRRYNNTMQAIAAAQESNALLDNEIQSRDKAINARVAIKLQGMREQAEYVAEAANIGAAGNSVSVGIRQRKGNTARASADLRQQEMDVSRGLLYDRTKLKLDVIYGEDISVTAKPSLAGLFTQSATDLGGIWDAHNPEDRRISGLLAKE